MMNTEHTEHTEIAKLIGDLQRAERERDALAATLETRTTEHALAMARVRELEAAPRPGQALFNALAGVDPDFAESIRATDLDPFHYDGRIPALLTAWRDRVRTLSRVRPLRIFVVGQDETVARESGAVDSVRINHVVAAHGSADAGRIANADLGGWNSITGTVRGVEVMVRTTTGETKWMTPEKLIASGVRRGVVTRGDGAEVSR
jgi:hypothetical protein